MSLRRRIRRALAVGCERGPGARTERAGRGRLARRLAVGLVALPLTAALVAGPVVAQICPGDCGDDGGVTIDDLVLAVRVSLGDQGIGACGAADFDGDGVVAINELIRGVSGALQGCGVVGQLEFFSGRLPPQWLIAPQEVADIRARLQALPPAAEPQEFPVAGRVAYRVNLSGASGVPDKLLVQNGIVETETGTDYAYFTDDQQLETLLQDSAIRAGVYAELQLEDAATAAGGQRATRAALRGASTLATVATRANPPLEPERWNKPNRARQACNNCYNYATNQPSGTLAQPGWAEGISQASPYTCGGVLAAAEADGLQYAGKELSEAQTRCDPSCALVALVNSGVDFHWYRQDADGLWSHKRGSEAATRVDFKGQPITDPSTAARDYGTAADNYSMFCGFMCVCRDKLAPLRGRKPPQPIPADWYGDCPENACHATPPVMNFPGCLMPGTPSLHACQCCSCILRITNPDGGGTCR